MYVCMSRCVAMAWAKLHWGIGACNALHILATPGRPCTTAYRLSLAVCTISRATLQKACASSAHCHSCHFPCGKGHVQRCWLGTSAKGAAHRRSIEFMPHDGLGGQSIGAGARAGYTGASPLIANCPRRWTSRTPTRPGPLRRIVYTPGAPLPRKAMAGGPSRGVCSSPPQPPRT